MAIESVNIAPSTSSEGTLRMGLSFLYSAPEKESHLTWKIVSNCTKPSIGLNFDTNFTGNRKALLPENTNRQRNALAEMQK
jgi:hypothetical protein